MELKLIITTNNGKTKQFNFGDMVKKIKHSLTNILAGTDKVEQEKLEKLKQKWEKEHKSIDQIFTGYETLCTLNWAVPFFELGKDLWDLHGNGATELTNEILNTLKKDQERINNQFYPPQK